ncbi:hypothetical protein E2C01_026875 [Portunus trituberculatus]|uniref:Uncharacterized protein n=1 Tax=Portunus trituberculatus TaxID=210409 RepID=A0A5B7EH97_PORTR|nr:hypothetical protein [Portunus trituberculatus]
MGRGHRTDVAIGCMEATTQRATLPDPKLLFVCSPPGEQVHQVFRHSPGVHAGYDNDGKEMQGEVGGMLDIFSAVDKGFPAADVHGAHQQELEKKIGRRKITMYNTALQCIN